MDTIANMLTIIRNGCIAKKDDVTVPKSKIKEKILEILKREGFVTAYETVMIEKHPYLKIKLSYDAKKKPVISNLRRISKPGRRIYVKHDEINPIRRGLGLSIISTSKGLLTEQEAVKNKIGGELICKIW